jgi:hypothetical protein
MIAAIAILDRERRAGGPASDPGGVVRTWSPDRSECRVVYSRCTASQLAGVVRDERARADAGGYALEWKVYGHDEPPDLPAALHAGGFEPDEAETVLVLELDGTPLRFDAPPYEIEVVHDARGLADVAAISTQIGRRDVEAETQRLAAMLRDAPDALSIHVAYVGGEPVACGRIHYGDSPGVAELAGGRTVTTQRRRGLFTALVASRLREAGGRGCRHVFVDALPTSEPILTKRGFRALTSTRPYLYEPGA